MSSSMSGAMIGDRTTRERHALARGTSGEWAHDAAAPTIRAEMAGRFLALLLVLLAACPVVACSAAGCDANDKGCLRVLFVGNSYTQVNDLPATFAALARAGGHRVTVGMAAEGGQTLAGHVTSGNTQGHLVPGRWDVVVLQEQSQFPSVPWSRDNEMAPAARSLVQEIRGIGARPLFFSTWAHRDGWPEQGLTSEGVMQSAIDAAYLALGQQLGVGVVPVGEAWSTMLAVDPSVRLWQDDGSHPTSSGTFLAAAVFYAALFGGDPVAASGGSGAPSAPGSGTLAAVARDLLVDRGRWGLN
jgi:hypothetical protein